MTPLLLLAAFLAVVVAGGTLVFVYDAVEAAVCSVRDRRSARPRRPARPRAPTAPVVAWRHLH
jgi:hypothetical protein